MRRNSLTILVGVLLIIIFALLLFTFQVRQTEIALVTTFDKPSRTIDEPGLQLKWPPHIQHVRKLDKRIQLFEYDKIDQTLTQDSFNLYVQVYIGWSITQPNVFFSSFPAATVEAARPALEALIRSAKFAVIGQHYFTDFVSTDTNQLKFVKIEDEMLKLIQPPALHNYGVTVKFLGIKKLGLPESVTQKVFERMIAERQQQIETLKSQGEAQASSITNNADADRDAIRAGAEGQATRIKGEAEAQAAKSYAVFEQNRELAIFIRQLRALEEVTKDKTTLVLDGRTRPFNLLTSPASNEMSAPITNQLSAPLMGDVDGKTTANKTP